MGSIDLASQLRYRICRTMLSFRPATELLIRTLVLAFLAIAIGASSVLLAQSQSTSARVQQLYADAKTSEAAGDWDATVAAYEQIIKIAPGLGPAYNNLGLFYFRHGQYEQAITVLERGLRVAPKLSSMQALLGISYYQMDKYTEAKPHLDAALRSNPADENVAIILAKDLLSLNEFSQAAAGLEQLAKRRPQNQEVWYLLGKVYMKLSEEALAKMNSIDPDSALSHEMSGQIMEGMKNFDGALVEYKKAAEMAPTRPGIHYMLGNVYYQLSAWDAAIEQFQSELRNDPSNCKAQAVIGNILLEQRREAENAVEALDKALAVCPSLTQAHADRGHALLTMNRNAEAIRELQIAEHASPDEPLTHFYLAQAYRASGQAQEAKSEMQLFSKLEEASHAATAKRAQEVIKNKEDLH